MLEEMLQRAAQERNVGNDEQAALIYEEAIKVCDENNNEQPEYMAVCLQELAAIYWQQGLFAKAIPLYRRLIAVGERILGAEHSDVIATMINLARCLEADQRFSQSDQMFKLAISRAEKAFGLDHALAQEIRKEYFEILSNREISVSNSDVKAEADMPIKKFSSLKQPKKIRNLRYAAQSFEEEANKLLKPRNLRHYWWGLIYLASLLLGLAVFIYSVSIFGTLPHGIVVPEQPMEKGMFSSVDGTGGVHFIDNKYAVLKNDVWHHKIPYFLLKGGISDLGVMLTSIFNRHDNWYGFSHDRLVTEDGNIYYASDAPELFVAEKMRKLAEFARRYYAACGCYPDKSEKLSNVPGLVFIDPFTRRAEIPSIKRLNIVDSRDVIFPGLAVDSTTADSYWFLRHGGFWHSEIVGIPGKISALALFTAQRCADGYKVIEFYIHGYDRDGKLITAGKAGTYYVLALHAGKDINDDHKEYLEEVDRFSVHPPERIYVVPGEDVDLRFMHQFGFGLLTFCVGLSFLAWILLESRKRTANLKRNIQPIEGTFLFLFIFWIVITAIRMLP